MPTIMAHVHAYVPEHNAGAETTIHDILKFLVKRGWEAHVVLKYYGGQTARDYEIDGVQVHVPGHKNRDFLHYLGKADVTISHLECSRHTHMLSNMFHKPTVHLVHNTHPLTVQWMQGADALIINTDWISKEPAYAEWSKPKMVLQPPVCPEDYKTTRGKSVTLVNLWEDKGAEIFYELAKRMPDVTFLGVRGGYGEQVIKDLPNVTVMEHTSEMKDVYGKTKVILMPSKYESFGRVGVEAMASGIPTLAHPTPGLLESLGDSGTFADRNDSDAWEKALRDLLKPAKYGKVSKLALARSKALADQRDTQLDYLGFFMEELARKGRI